MNREEKPRLDNLQAASPALDFVANQLRAETVWQVAEASVQPQAFFLPVVEVEVVGQDEPGQERLE